MAADFVHVTLSWRSTASIGPSRLTVEGSNADGLQGLDFGNASQTTNWSLVTGINLIGRAQGAEAVTSHSSAHYRWYRLTVAPANHSAASAVNAWMFGQSW